MSRVATRFSELASLEFGKLLEIHERIEILIARKSEREGLRTGTDLLRKVTPGAVSSAGALVAAKYRDPQSGVTWSGRGKEPRWMSHLIRKGAKREDFRIGKAH